MGSIGKRQAQGVSERLIVTRWDSEDQFNSDAMQQAREEYFKLLLSLGVFGDPDTLDAYIMTTDLWHQNQVKENNAKKYGNTSFTEVTADEYVKMTPAKRFKHYMSFDEFKKACIRLGSFSRFAQHKSMADWLHIFYGGASKEGYGKYTKGSDARQIWDGYSGFSDFLDKTPQLHINTDQPMYRGLRLGNKSIEDLKKLAAKGGTVDFKGPSSWSMKEVIAKFFTTATLVGQRNQNSVIFENVTTGDHNAMPFPYGTDSEVIYNGHSSFQVLSVTQDDKGIYHVKVKEV